MKNRYFHILIPGLLLVLLGSIGQVIFISYAEEPIKVIAASATSYSDDSLPVTDLLDLNKEGSWKPKALDSGVDEGLFFQFKNPVLIDWVEIKIKGGAAGYNLDYYLNGKRNLRTKEKIATNELQDTVDNGVEYGFQFKDIGKDRLYLLCAMDYRGYLNNSKPYGPLNVKVKSIFLKISYSKIKAEIVSIRFFRSGNKKPLTIEVPKSINGNVTATSTLSPVTAYNILNLFDSRLEFAWATNGKQTSGVGESFSIQFAEPQDLAGLLIWNGYQRSETHYYANARPSRINIKTEAGAEFEVTLKDKMGEQFISFPKTVENINSLNVVIKSVYPGKAYQDMVISELKLLDNNDRVVLVNAPSVKMETNHPELRRALDYSLKPYMLGILDSKQAVPEPYSTGFEASCDYPHRSIRFRSNGSFVCYTDDGIMEGNWEPVANGVRIFGKKYYTNPFSSIYLQEVRSKTTIKIFQENIAMIDITKLSLAEAKKFFKPILADRHFYQEFTGKSISAVWWMGIKPYGEARITGISEETT
jgi:hypothetical protein